MPKYDDIEDVPDDELPPALPLPGERQSDEKRAGSSEFVLPPAPTSGRGMEFPEGKDASFLPAGYGTGKFGGDEGDIADTLERIASTLERVEMLLARATA